MPTQRSDEAQESPGVPARPPQQLRVKGHDTGRHLAEVLRDIQQRPDRDSETGRFLPGNTAAGTTLARSEAFWSAVAGAKADLATRLRVDLGVDDGAATTLEGMVDGYAEARLLRSAMFLRLTELGGPITSKGKARALFSTYLQVLDREIRLALALGLERKAKSIRLREYVEGHRVEIERDPSR